MQLSVCLIRQSVKSHHLGQSAEGGYVQDGQPIDKDPRLEPVTAAILSRGAQYSAVDAFDALTELQRHAGTARQELAKVAIPTVGWAMMLSVFAAVLYCSLGQDVITVMRLLELKPCTGMQALQGDVCTILGHLAGLCCQGADHLLPQVDVLLVPTTLHHYTIPEIEATEKHADPPTWALNAKLGRFTNFVNLLDMCGVSVPSGVLRSSGSDLHDADGMAPDLQTAAGSLSLCGCGEHAFRP